MYHSGLFILCFLFAGLSMAAERYINILTPAAHDIVDPGQPLLVSGTGRGMFEGNVVVRIEDTGGEQLLQMPTTMTRDDIAAEGVWQISITLPRMLPDTLVLSAFSPSPREGEAAISSRSITLTTQIASGLQEADWKLTRYRDVAGQVVAVLQDTRVIMHFSDGKISGSAGCNRYVGSYTSGAADQLSFSKDIGITMMACVPPVADQENVYFRHMAAVAGFQITGNSLQLFDKGHQTVLEYTAIKSSGLEGMHWQAAGINNGKGGVVSTATTELATAQFNDGNVSGHAGCNTFNASYEISANRITIGHAMTTRMHCAEPEGIMQQEQEYLQALFRARVYELTDTGLRLLDENGSLQVNYIMGEK